MPRVPVVLCHVVLLMLGSTALFQQPVARAQESERSAAEEAPPKAQEGDSPTTAPEIDDLDQRLRILERKDELEKEQQAEKAKQAPTVVAGRDGFTFRSADGAYVIKFRGYVQADGRYWGEDELKPATDTFLIRRARPILEGTAGRFFEFKIMPDFGDGRTVLQEAYMDWKFADSVRLRAGKFKVPFGLERLQSAVDLAFVERGLPTNLVPNRDEGIQIFGDVSGGVLSYAAGVFNGVVDAGSTDIDNTDGKESAGRVFLLPFKKTDALSLQQLGVGVAATYGSTAGTPAAPDLPVYRTTSLQTFFSYITDAGAGGVPPATAAGTAVADGRRYRLSPQAYYYNGRFGLMAEYAISHQEVVRDTATADLRHTAWQGTVTILLTDDTASYKGVTPKRPFDPSAGNWGAFELALRGGAQRIDDDTFPLFSDISKSARVAREWRGGVNWHLNRNCKLMLDYAETRFDGGAASGEDREVEKVLQNRFQVSF